MIKFNDTTHHSRGRKMRCEETDLIEVACMKHFMLKVATLNKVYQGVAKDIVYNSQRAQCLLVEQDGQEVLIEMDSILKLTALTQNPFFKSINFKTDS
ncbi:Rho-binding antiterminator [Pseudoalteromonas sp. Of7M-16]|nr:Rho-binding antiterminator [Pseudoalteromonas sp. Of7M-16]